MFISIGLTIDRICSQEMNVAKEIELEIEKFISKSEVPEDRPHSKNTKDWVIKLFPEADFALQIAALGHDIERSIKEKKIKREEYLDYNKFKEAHSHNSAKIMRKILQKYKIDSKIIDKVTYLIENHEFGGNPEVDILKDADSISFFDVNLPKYFPRNTKKETYFRIKWGFDKLSKRARFIVNKFSYDNIELDTLFRKVINMNNPESSSS